MSKSNLQLGLRLGLVVALALILVAGAVTPAQAAVIDNTGRIAKDAVINDDLILTGQENVTMDGTVNGMLVAAGRSVTINGKVNGDAVLAGQSIIIGSGAEIDGNLFVGGQRIDLNGKVTGSVAAGSQALIIGQGASIARNLYSGGFSLEENTGSTIGKDLFAGGYQVILNGEVAQDVHIGGGAAEINGKIGRNAYLDIGKTGENVQMGPMFMFPNQPQIPPTIPSGLRISKDAQIGGKLTYTSPQDQGNAIQSKPAGGLVYQTPVPTPAPKNAPAPRLESRFPVLGWFFGVARNFVTLLVLGALALWLLPKVFERTVEMARSKVAPSAGYGVLTIILGYLAAFVVLLMIIIIGIVLSLLTLGGLSSAFFGVSLSGLAVAVTILTLLVSYGSKIVVSYLVGTWIVRQLFPQASGIRWWGLLVGVVIYVILRSIPILGEIIALIVTIIGIGAMALVYLNAHRPAAPAAPPAAPTEVNPA
jgi:hypothetical protein